jgi:pyruvate/2-oxoglutarate dehydrogenase complex dihydrolipoamide acyltransferase (E2) component
MSNDPPMPTRRSPAEPAVAPTAWLLIEADFGGVRRAVEREAAAFRQRVGAPLTDRVYLLRAVVLALGGFPLLNAAWAGDAIRRYGTITLGIETAGPGPPAPRVIAGAGGLSLAGLARALAAPAGPAGAPVTFGVTETGDDLAALAQPPLPPGQAARLTVSGPAPRLVVVDGALAVRPIARLGLLFDHRVLDGAPAGRFLQAVRAWLEGEAPDAALD